MEKALPFYIPGTVTLAKAVAGAPDDDRRLITIEASNEGIDTDQEIVAQTALVKAHDYFLLKGYIDWRHLSTKAAGDWSPRFIIGQPVDVEFAAGGTTYVTGELHKGTNKRPMEFAEDVWAGLNATPPVRYFASVGGEIRDVKDVTVMGKAVRQITDVIWTHIAIDPSPTNQYVNEVELFGDLVKALSVGTETDTAGVEAGQALQRQSLEGAAVVTTTTPGGGAGKCEHLTATGKLRAGLTLAEALVHAVVCEKKEGLDAQVSAARMFGYEV